MKVDVLKKLEAVNHSRVFRLFLKNEQNGVLWILVAVMAILWI